VAMCRRQVRGVPRSRAGRYVTHELHCLPMDVLIAVADPVRREIIELLRGRPMTAGEIAAAFPISRPAISRHLRVLREQGLAVDRASDTDGRGRIYRLDVGPLTEIQKWISSLRGFDPFDALETEVRRTRRERQASTRTNPSTRRSTA